MAGPKLDPDDKHAPDCSCSSCKWSKMKIRYVPLVVTGLDFTTPPKTVELEPAAPPKTVESDTGPLERKFNSLREWVKESFANASRDFSAMHDRINALEKQLAVIQTDPILHRAPREKIDYTKWMDFEDTLEEDYRGWPVRKERIIF